MLPAKLIELGIEDTKLNFLQITPDEVEYSNNENITVVFYSWDKNYELCFNEKLSELISEHDCVTVYDHEKEIYRKGW